MSALSTRAFEHLFKPIQIGPMEVPNRICFSAHSSHFVEDGLPTERQARYYAERAKGGAGWIVVGGAVAAHEASYQHPSMNVVEERGIPGFRRLVDAVHEHGAKISTQMEHWGDAMRYPRWGRRPLLAPSALPDIGGLEVPKAIDHDDIQELLAATARSARTAREAGFDGVETLGSMGFSLVQLFLSPRMNRRADEYGGSIENRMRFPLQLLETIRAEIGPEMALGLKLSGDELVDGGLDQEACRELARRFAESGLLDYLHVCVGTLTDTSVWLPEMSYPPGFAAYLAGGVREIVDLPILTVKRINDPVQAEQILADGQADLVAMARALIADPELPNKAREGRLQEIRQCTASNQECAHRSSNWLPFSCIHNPAVGYEERWGIGTTVPAPARRKVVIVGGGPGGMKTAELAAERGHEVHLLEREEALGGQVRWISSINSRKDFESVTRYLTHQMKRLGVYVRLGEEATVESVLALEPDAVVIATGARGQCSGFSAYRPSVERMPGAGQNNVLTVFEVFGATERVGRRVLVVDDFSDAEGTMIAEHLADRGHEVEIVTRNPFLAMQVHEDDLGVTLGRLAERRVTMTVFTGVDAIEGMTVRGTQLITGEAFEREVDTVVLHLGKQVEDGLYTELKARGVENLYRVGDCVAPRRITDAIYEGNIVGREV